MKKTSLNRLFLNLDMVIVSNVKKRGLLNESITVYVNSALFYQCRFYCLQTKNVKYEIEGLVKEAWNYILKKEYKKANSLFDSILKYSDKSYQTYFGKFVVSIFLSQDGYPYLKMAIETKIDSINDDYCRIYLMLYNELLDIDDDYIPLLELLGTPKRIVAFNKKSYNGLYLDFLRQVELSEYDQALKTLNKCMTMKSDIYLDILKYLLELVIKHKKELKKIYEKQEKELEKRRFQEFSKAIKEKDLVKTKAILEKIILYREQSKQNNYIYYLFLELLNTIDLVNNSNTFEIMPVNYKYENEEDYLYTFYEAIEIGDFKKSYEVGKKCRRKSLDTKQSVVKVNLYVILLEILFDKLEERTKNIDNLYQILINNIESKNYKHALNLYNENAEILKSYNNRLVNYLFKRLIDKSNAELEFDVNDITHEDECIKIDDFEVDFEEVKEDIVEEQMSPNEEPQVLEQDENMDSSVKIITPINNNLQIFLRHNEPNHEYFHKYQACLINKNYKEAKIWLDRYATILEENGIKKRLDYYYYQINLGIAESRHPEEDLHRKKQIYFFAYNSILEGKYDDALMYLNYYIEDDTDNDNRGYLLLGRLYTILKQFDKAINAYINANNIASTPDAYYFLGELYYKKHRWTDAIFCYLTYNDFYPKENPTVYLNLSECYKRIGKSNKVVKYLKIADEINVEQKRGLYLKDRILRAEMLERRKREHFLLNKGNNSKFINDKA